MATLDSSLIRPHHTPFVISLKQFRLLLSCSRTLELVILLLIKVMGSEREKLSSSRNYF